MIGAFTTLFREVEWLRACAPQLAVFDGVAVTVATCASNWLGPEPQPPARIEEVQELCKQHGFLCETVTPHDRQRGFGMQRQRGIETLRARGHIAAAYFSVDELYTVDHARRLKTYLATFPKNIWQPERTITLWRTPKYQVGYTNLYSGLPIDVDCFGHETGTGFGERYDYYAPLAVNKYGVMRDVMCWHFSFVRSVQEMREKLFGFSLSCEHSQRYFAEWLAWTPGQAARVGWPVNGHPVEVDIPVPEELIERTAHMAPGWLP